MAREPGASSTEAAEVVRAARAREAETARARAAGAEEERGEVELETVSSGWEGAEIGGVDEDEMDRRQRRLQEKLERKETEIRNQAAALHKLRSELKALEEPMKAKIFAERRVLEEMNKEEGTLVDSVNSMRKALREAEDKLRKVREDKRGATDKLIETMASYEEKKMERIQKIAELVGDREVLEEKAPKAKSGGNGNPQGPKFGGF